jgi:hypothetical protein
MTPSTKLSDSPLLKEIAEAITASAELDGVDPSEITEEQFDRAKERLLDALGA